MRLLTALYERWRVLVHEMAKFGIVGAVNTVVHFGLANLLHLKVGWDGLTSNGIAIAVAATSSYYMNRHCTFRHRARSGLRREYSLFFLLNGVGWLISQACVWLTLDVLDLRGPIAYNAALVAGVVLGMGFRFGTYKKFVFLDPARAAGEALGEGSVAELSPEATPPSGVAGQGLGGEPTFGADRHHSASVPDPTSGPLSPRHVSGGYEPSGRSLPAEEHAARW